MIQLSIQQSFAYRHNASARRHLLNKILSSQDEILEFDPKTGGLKHWAWPKKDGFDGGRLPLCYFAGYRATHFLVFPCCLCALLLGDVTESAVFVASTGPYCGFWVASCAQDICEFFVPLDRFFTKKDIVEKDYLSRTPSPVLHIRESALAYQHEERCDTPGLLDMRSPIPIDMPRYNPPPAVEQSVDELMGRLNTWPKPGIHVKQFLELYAVCKCGMVTSRRYFDAHECIPCV